MKSAANHSATAINDLVTKEFDSFVLKLTNKGINVIAIDDTLNTDTPDSIFPNNWISFHEDGRIGLYPMYAANRRQERRMDLLDILQKQYGFFVGEAVDLTHYENEECFLEGTGSMELDRINKIAYAALSERTNKSVFNAFCKAFDYTSVSFVANQTVNGQRLPIYHTNVMMCLGDKFAVVCLDAIDDAREKKMLIGWLKLSRKDIIEISEDQKHQFTGNMLQIQSDAGTKYIVMSSSAYNALSEKQVNVLQQYGEIIHSSLETIETYGGGSARCMMAEVFLPKNDDLLYRKYLPR